jgi:tripeptidyl-peptidase-2
MLGKGDFIIKLHIRHEKPDVLEKLKTTAIHLRHSLDNVSQDVYPSIESLIKFNKKSNIGKKLYKNQQYSMFLDTLNDEKLLKLALPGNFLKGELSFYNDSAKNKIVIFILH